MSVNYKAIYGYGFLVSPDEIAQIPDNLIDEFEDSQFHHLIDNSNDNRDEFFGLILCSAIPGYAIRLSPIDNYSHDNFIKMIQEFKKFFPKHEAMSISHYLINQIDM